MKLRLLWVQGYFSAREMKQMEGDVPNWKSDSQVIDRVDARARDLGVDRDPLVYNWCTHEVENSVAVSIELR